MKKKITIALGLVILLSSCSNDSYVSQRHPNAATSEKTKQEESTEIKYTTGKNENTSEKSSSSQSNNKEESNSDKSSSSDSSKSEKIDEDTINFTVKDEVNMRLAPSKDSDIVIQLEPGSDLLKIGENGEWTRITYDGYTGYVLTELLSPKK